MKVASTEQLQMLNSKAARRGLNKSIRGPIYNVLDPEGVHLLMPVTLYADSEHYRCIVYLKLQGTMTPETVFLDVLMDDYKMLVDAPKDEEE